MTTSSLTISSQELRNYVTDVVATHLVYFTDQLITAATRQHRETMHTKTFALAVGATALILTPARSYLSIARDSLETYEGLETVGRAYPELPLTTPHGWRDRIDEAWQTVHYRKDAIRPQDQGVFGYIEILEALGKGTAYYGYQRPE